MRRRIPYRVCQCMPSGVVTHLEARLLKDLVNHEMHPIRCAESCKRKFMKGSRLGDICAETGHFWWALKVWRFTASLIENKDYDDWCDVWFNTDRVRLRDVISETECELLIRRCSDLWRALGFPEYAWWDEKREYFASNYFGTYYYYLYAEKYDGYYEYSFEEFEAEMEECRKNWELDLFFREVMDDFFPLGSQNFDEYWHDNPQIEDFS